MSANLPMLRSPDCPPGHNEAADAEYAEAVLAERLMNDEEFHAALSRYVHGGTSQRLAQAIVRFVRRAEREASTPSARSDIQDPVFISELSAAGEKSGAVGGEGGGA